MSNDWRVIPDDGFPEHGAACFFVVAGSDEPNVGYFAQDADPNLGYFDDWLACLVDSPKTEVSHWMLVTFPEPPKQKEV